MVSRADLHVHSKYSNRPTEWILRRIGAPECYTPPRAIYDTARRRGMQFVTISDHNCITGALDIAHLPGAFVSNEITAYFPEDHCKVHVLCWDITEAQFAEIQALRQNIVELRDYLHSQRIAHACAHPLYDINDRLTIDHFEQLLLLFNVFEALNGARHARANDLVHLVLEHLTREQFEDMADRHAIAPIGETPWIKSRTGGSDDHSGLFIAKAYTECPHVASIDAFLTHVRSGSSCARGIDGSPLSFAHSLYSIGYQYYRDRFFTRTASGGELMTTALGEVFRRAQPQSGLRDRMSHYARRLTRRSLPSAEARFKTLVSQEMATLFGDDWLRDDFVASAARDEELNRKTFQLSSRIANQLLFQFANAFTDRLSAGSIFGSLEAISAAAPVALGVAPYLFAFAHQNRDKALLTEVRHRFLPGQFGYAPRPKRAWCTDAPNEVNGVTTLVRTMAGLARMHGHDLTVISVADRQPDWHAHVRNFLPVGYLQLPELESVKLPLPPLLDMVDYCDREQFTQMIVSTPGPAGLAALATARLLGMRLTGIYHTDLPQYIRYYTDDEAMEGAAWTYLRWFYSQMDEIYVPSRGYMRQLVLKGLDPAKLRLLPHGVDADLFHPRHRSDTFWGRHGATAGPVAVYVGRVGREKDLDILVEAYARLAPARPDATFAVVGDGPYLAQMKARLPYPNVVFTGFLFDDALSQAYASADVFVFPSTTDTFGNVVLEAMASGLPVVVSDRGGPSEIVTHGDTGFVVRGRDIEALRACVERLLDDAPLRQRMARASRACAETRDWDHIYQGFWYGRTPAGDAGAPLAHVQSPRPAGSASNDASPLAFASLSID